MENDITLSALNNALKKCDNVKVLYNTKVDNYKIPSATKKDAVPDENVVIELSDGKLIETPLLVGADGFRYFLTPIKYSFMVHWFMVGSQTFLLISKRPQIIIIIYFRI